MPNGFQTLVGERGIKLSGGQRQRIAIARALLRNADILILDEALSSVDSENELIIQDALDRLMEGRTTLVFAHRLSSIISSDRILVLNNGKIEEEGNHDQLIKKRGTYYNLMSSQVQEMKKERSIPIRMATDIFLEKSNKSINSQLNLNSKPELPDTARPSGWTDS